MTHALESQPSYHERPQYDIELINIYGNSRPVLPFETFDVAVKGLDEQYEEHNHRPYHDGYHPLDVTGRTLQWMDYLAAQTDTKLNLEDYEVGIISPTYHDYFLLGDDGDGPEKRSGQLAYDRILAARGSKSLAKRSQNAIESTEVQYIGDEVLLSQVLKATPDIVAVSLVLADIGAVLTEDGDKIIVDASNLAAEKLLTIDDDQVPIEEVMAIFNKQPTFAKERFTDLPGILAHHLGIDKALVIHDAIQEQMAAQRRKMFAQAALIADKHAAIREKIEPIVNNTELTHVQKALKFSSAVREIVHFHSE